MLKNILIKCAEYLNRNDIITALKQHENIDSIEDNSLQIDIIKLISFYNYTVNTIFENYFDLIFTDTATSNDEYKIYYHDFSFKPIKIISLSDNTNNFLSYSVYPNYISVQSSFKTYKITYKYLPEEVKNLTDSINLPSMINKKIICYAMVSEFLASKNLFSESDYWKNKFMYEIFKVKTHKGRHIKSTFCLWTNQKKLIYTQILNNHQINI